MFGSLLESEHVLHRAMTAGVHGQPVNGVGGHADDAAGCKRLEESYKLSTAHRPATRTRSRPARSSSTFAQAKPAFLASSSAAPA